MGLDRLGEVSALITENVARTRISVFPDYVTALNFAQITLEECISLIPTIEVVTSALSVIRDLQGTTSERRLAVRHRTICDQLK